MKIKSSSGSNIQMSNLTIRENQSSQSLGENTSTGGIKSPNPSIRNNGNNYCVEDELLLNGSKKVSEWYDTDSQRRFMKNVRSGDIVELRNSRTSHWGIATRIKQPPSPNGKKGDPDEIMIYHLIHSPSNRGQVGQFTIEEFWQPECRIRINNTTNGMTMGGKSKEILSKSHVLENAFTAHMSTTLKWQTCCEFIRWTCDEYTHSSSPTKSYSKH